MKHALYTLGGGGWVVFMILLLLAGARRVGADELQFVVTFLGALSGILVVECLILKARVDAIYAEAKRLRLALKDVQRVERSGYTAHRDSGRAIQRG